LRHYAPTAWCECTIPRSGTGSNRVSTLPSGIEGDWRKAVANLETVLTTHDASRGRGTLMDQLGEMRVVAKPEEIRFETKKDAVEGAFVRAAGSQQIYVVAGA